MAIVDFLEDTDETLPVSASERVFDGAIFHLTRETFSYSGDSLTREFVGHPGAVAIVAVDQDERIAVVKQYRHPVRKRMWEIPAGLLDIPGEEPIAAARRELAEETDLIADRWIPLLSMNNSPGGSSELLRIFLATGLAPTGRAFAREAEESDMEIAFAPLPAILDAILAGRVGNPSLVAGVLGYAAWRTRQHR